METPMNDTTESQSFEEALARLEYIVGQLNTGRAPLAEALSLFEEGAKLLALCTTQLDQAEQAISQVIPNRETKEPEFFPLEEEV